jgi:hypothetical protein
VSGAVGIDREVDISGWGSNEQAVHSASSFGSSRPCPEGFQYHTTLPWLPVEGWWSVVPTTVV